MASTRVPLAKEASSRARMDGLDQVSTRHPMKMPHGVGPNTFEIMHPGYPPDIPSFPEVLVRDPQSVEIIHITGWGDHALEQKKKPTICVVDHNNPNEFAGR
eukprot:204774-Prymnesium_polylepis.1